MRIKQGMKMIRVSDMQEENDERNQDMVIDPFMAQNGYNCWFTYKQLDVSRDEALGQCKDILAKVDEGAVEGIIYRDHTRVGFGRDFSELGWFVQELKQRNCKIIRADQGLEYDMSKPEVTMGLVFEQNHSAGEILGLSYRSQLGKLKAFNRKSSPGKTPLFGYDWQVVDRENILKYTVRHDGYKLWRNEKKEVMTHLTPKKKHRRTKTILRTLIYPTGHEIAFNDSWEPLTGTYRDLRKNKPPLGEGDRKIETPNQERAKLVRLIFQLLDVPEPKTPTEAANYVNAQGYTTITGEPWFQKSILDLVQNPTYKGCPVYLPTGKAKEKVNQIAIKAHEMPLSEVEKAALRIVSPEQWARVNAHLPKKRTCGCRSRRPDTGAYWLRNYMFCSCGRPMFVDARPERPYYRCQKCGAIKAECAHYLIENNWLDWLQNNFAPVAAPNQPKLDLDYLQPSEELLGWCQASGKVATKMINFYMPKLPGMTEGERQLSYYKLSVYYSHHKIGGVNGFIAAAYKDLEVEVFVEGILSSVERERFISLPGSGYSQVGNFDPIAALYQIFWERESVEAKTQDDALKAQEQELYVRFKSLPANMIDLSRKEAEQLMEKRKALEPLLKSSLVEEDRNIKAHQQRLCEDFRKLHSSIKDATGANKAIKFSPYLHKITIHFGKKGRWTTIDMITVEAKPSIASDTKEAMEIPIKVFNSSEYEQVDIKFRHPPGPTPKPKPVQRTWQPDAKERHSKQTRAQALQRPRGANGQFLKATG